MGFGFCTGASKESNIDDCIPPSADGAGGGGGGGGLGFGFCTGASKESNIDDCMLPVSEGVGFGFGFGLCGAVSKESKIDVCIGCAWTAAASSCPVAFFFFSKASGFSAFSSTAYNSVFIEANSFPRRDRARETSNADAYRTLLLVLSLFSKSGADEKSMILFAFARTRSLAESYFFFSFAIISNTGGTTTSSSPAGKRAMHRAAWFCRPSQTCCTASRNGSSSTIKRPLIVKRFRVLSPILGVQSPNLVSSPPMLVVAPPPPPRPTPAPANPPPPPIALRFKPLAVGADCDCSTNREIIKARDKSFICVTIISSALLTIGGSASKKKAAATPYLRFLRRL